MKLVHVDLEKPIAIHRNCPTEWIIESPELFLKYVEQLQKQTASAHQQKLFPFL